MSTTIRAAMRGCVCTCARASSEEAAQHERESMWWHTKHLSGESAPECPARSGGRSSRSLIQFQIPVCVLITDVTCWHPRRHHRCCYCHGHDPVMIVLGIGTVNADNGLIIKRFLFYRLRIPKRGRVFLLRKGQLNRHTRYRPATRDYQSTTRNTATQRSCHSVD